MESIVFLWRNPVPYQIYIYDKLAEWGYRVIVYHHKQDEIAPCNISNKSAVDFRYTQDLTNEELINQINIESPSLIVTTGWAKQKADSNFTYPFYKKVCRHFMRQGIPVICKIDTQYLQTFRQKLGFLISPFYIKPYFSHMLVPGVRQYYFARRLGYDKNHILLFGLSANTDFFKSINIQSQAKPYSKNFFFLGRLVSVKGLDILKQAWLNIKDKKGWTMTIIGSGPEKDRLSLESIPGVKVYDYMQHDELKKFINNAGVYVLPSVYEAWSVSIHEMAAAGLPLLCSDACGAVPHFLINGYNGYVFKSKDSDSLMERMEYFINASDEELNKMGERSRELSMQITPEFTAASIISVIK